MSVQEVCVVRDVAQISGQRVEGEGEEGEGEGEEGEGEEGEGRGSPLHAVLVDRQATQREAAASPNR